MQSNTNRIKAFAIAQAYMKDKEAYALINELHIAGLLMPDLLDITPKPLKELEHATQANG